MMISRRNLAIILIIMAITFFLFQFSQMAKDVGNNYDVNRYEELEVYENESWQQEKYDIADSGAKKFKDGEFILYIGASDSAVSSIVSQWTVYSKRNLVVCNDAKAYENNKLSKPEFVIVDSEKIDFSVATDIFTKMTEEGISLVFCNLPSTEIINSNTKLRDLLGISAVYKDEITVEGIELFEGFLLGGEVIYEPKKAEEEKRQDLNLTMPWYITAGGTKTYMVGLMDKYFEDYELKNDYVPAIIWRNSMGAGQVFCVNGNFMSDTAGIGLLSSMIFELSAYQIYPVVNAQNTLVVDFPILANENSEKMYELYSRNVNAFQNEIVWPTLISFSEKNKLKYTCLMTPKYNYDDPSEAEYDAYPSYLYSLNEQNAETAVSLQHPETIKLPDKVSKDQDFYDRIGVKYTYTSAFCEITDLDVLYEAIKSPYLKNVRTIACNENVFVPILSYLTDNITLQSLTSNTKDFFYSRDLMLKSVETALGYDNAELNLGQIIWGTDEGDRWEVVYNDMASSLDTYWKPFRAFDQTTLTESDQRVRTFLNIYSSFTREGDVITLNISGRNGRDAWFILRTHAEVIDAIEGATYTKIENNAYLIKADADVVKINVKNERGSLK